MNEIDRRSLLRAGAVAIGVGLAGCSGGGDDGESDDGGDETQGEDGQDDGGEEDGGGENGGEENEQARETFEAAVETLGAVEEVLAIYRDVERAPGELGQGQIEPEGIEELRSRLDDAGATLDGLDASGDLATQVGIAQDVVTFQALLVDSLERWREHDLTFRDAVVAQGSEEFETAAEEYGTVADVLSEYRPLLDEIESAHAAIDSGSFEAESVSYDQAVWAYLRIGSRGELDAREAFAAGEQARVTGLGAFFEAEQSWSNEEFEAAGQGYEEAGDAFREATTAYGRVVDNPDTPDVISEAVDGRIDETSNLVDAMPVLTQAAEEAAAGNLTTAGELRQEARDLFA